MKSQSENGPVNMHLYMSCSQEPVNQGILPLFWVISSRTFFSGCSTVRKCDLMFPSITGDLTCTSITVYDANPSRGLNFETWLLATNRSFLDWELLSPPAVVVGEKDIFMSLLLLCSLSFAFSLDFAIALCLSFGVACVQPVHYVLVMV